jgi:guanylate kinase
MKFVNPPLFIISAPSGAGKTTIFKQAQQSLSNLVFSVSYTTRKPRKNEADGVDYFFVEKEDFIQRIDDNEFLEWAQVHGSYYGTSHRYIKDAWKAGQIVVLDIDVQGATQLMDQPDLEAIFIFIKPPSLEELRFRLKNRGTESKESSELRLKNAEWELTFEDRYDYVIINDKIDKAVWDFLKIILEKSTDPSESTNKTIDEMLHLLIKTP